MSESKNMQFPFKSLGKQLKSLREKRSESLAEVSGAVEIDIEALNLIEQGSERPSEDILSLLISYFEAKEDIATKLWKMAGYTPEPAIPSVNEPMSMMQPAMMVLPIDARIVYSDTVNVVVNNYGVVMNFMQNAGPNNQPLAIARVGMSKEHARSIIEVLQKTLTQAEPKHLPAPEQDKNA